MTGEDVAPALESIGAPRRGRRLAWAWPTVFVVTSLFLTHCVTGLYRGIGREVPDTLALLVPVCLAFSVITWFSDYSQRHRIVWVVDMGAFLLAAWIIVVPYYVLVREGKRGLGRIGLFCLTYLAAWATGLAVSIWVRALSGR